MRDQLRVVECPKEIIDWIGGWSSNDVGERYGERFKLSKASDWINKLPLINYLTNNITYKKNFVIYLINSA